MQEKTVRAESHGCKRHRKASSVPVVSGVLLSVIDYGLGLTTLSQSSMLKLDSVQNEAKRVSLGVTKDTPIDAIRYLLDLPSMEAKHMVEQVKVYPRCPGNPLHDAVKEEKGCRLARGKS